MTRMPPRPPRTKSHSPSRAWTSTPAERADDTGVTGAATGKTNLLGLDPQALVAWCAGLGEKPFRAQQLLRWVHQRGEDDFAAMTDLAKSFRATLAERACVEQPSVVADPVSDDGTPKWLRDL